MFMPIPALSVLVFGANQLIHLLRVPWPAWMAMPGVAAVSSPPRVDFGPDCPA